jgi:hypothetical protein
MICVLSTLEEKSIIQKHSVVIKMAVAKNVTKGNQNE